MDDSDNSTQNKLLEFVRSNLLIVGVFLAGMILLVIGMIQILGQKQASINFESAREVSASVNKIKVDVEGQVLKPGVYELSQDARVQDALVAAGGLTTDSNRKIINLAAKIADGQKIYIPAVGENVPASIVNGSDTANSIISINSSSQNELETLPAIGPVTAGKIIDGRPYGSVEELLTRKVLGKSTFDKIKDLVSL